MDADIKLLNKIQFIESLGFVEQCPLEHVWHWTKHLPNGKIKQVWFNWTSYKFTASCQ